MPEMKKVGPRPAEVSYLQPAALPGIMMVTAAFHGASIPPSTIDRRWTFARTDVGDGDAVVGKTEIRLVPGVLLALEPGDCVTPVRHSSERTAFRTLLVEPEFFARFVETAFPDGSVKLRRGILGDGAVSAFDAFWSGVQAGDGPLEQEGLLAAFLEAASDNTIIVAGAQITPPIARAKKLLEDRIADDVRLEQLEQEIGLSRFYLVRRIRAEVGMPPHASQLAIRLDRARVMVASGVALSEVASRCGFTDQSHLTRHFRRATGVAPGAYARSAGVLRR
jgi:AraC-like DNA-binding protein